MHFRNCFTQHSVFTIRRFLPHSLPDKQIIISMQSRLSLIHCFHHKCAFSSSYPHSSILFYFSYVVDSPFHFYRHPKPIFREYFLWAFAPFVVFLLMLSALYILLYRILYNIFPKDTHYPVISVGNILQLLLFLR